MAQRNRDYIAKRLHYQNLGMPEYWIVDPQAATILVLELREESYREAITLSGEDELRWLKTGPEGPWHQLGPLNTTVQELFAAVDVSAD